MTIKLKDLIKILSTLATITTGLVELAKQVNIYREKDKEKPEEKK